MTPTKAKNEANILIGESDESLDSRSDFLDRLGNLAFAKSASLKKKETVKDRYAECRWFFVLPQDFAEENKNDVGIEQLEVPPFNLEILKRAESFKNNVGTPVATNIDTVSHFLLNEITPMLLGLDGGVEQARSVINDTVSDVDPYPFLTLELLTREAVKMKLAKFVAEYFDLPSSEVDTIIARILPPKQREVVVPVPMEGSRYEQSRVEKTTK